MAKRIWTATDLARELGWAPLRARRLLLKLDAKHGGTLLLPREGPNAPHAFYVAVLRKLEPDLLTPLETLEARIDELTEDLAAMRRDVKYVAGAVAMNTRGLARVGHLVVHGRMMKER